MVNKFLYPNGGSETYIFELGKCLTAMGHEVQYFGMEHEGRIVGNKAEIYTKDMEFHGGGIKDKLAKLIYPFKIIYSKEAYRKITKVLKNFEPDVVHINNINFQLTPSIIEAVADYDLRNHTDTRIVATAHDYQWVCPNHMMKKPLDGQVCFACEGGKYCNCIVNKCIHGSVLRSVLGAFEAWLYKTRKTYGLVDTVICPSEFMRNKLETNPELKGKCITLHNFLVSNDTDDKNEFLKIDAILAAKTDKKIDKYVLYFGRFAEEKGVKTLIETCKRLPEIQFVFAGNGPLKEAVDGIDNIVDVGFLSSVEMHAVISNAQFTVFPSEWYENCPFSVMESQQFGTPIIASNLGGTPELIEDGVSGELFTVGNVDELTSRISNLWDNEELLHTYREGCKKALFDTVQIYSNNLIEIYLS